MPREPSGSWSGLSASAFPQPCRTRPPSAKAPAISQTCEVFMCHAYLSPRRPVKWTCQPCPRGPAPQTVRPAARGKPDIAAATRSAYRTGTAVGFGDEHLHLRRVRSNVQGAGASNGDGAAGVRQVRAGPPRRSSGSPHGVAAGRGPCGRCGLYPGLATTNPLAAPKWSVAPSW
jgi:hypothetical protein